jgi:hypothetical protein
MSIGYKRKDKFFNHIFLTYNRFVHLIDDLVKFPVTNCIKAVGHRRAKSEGRSQIIRYKLLIL